MVPFVHPTGCKDRQNLKKIEMAFWSRERERERERKRERERERERERRCTCTGQGERGVIDIFG